MKDTVNISMLPVRMLDRIALSLARSGPVITPQGPSLPSTVPRGPDPFDPENSHPHQICFIFDKARHKGKVSSNETPILAV